MWVNQQEVFLVYLKTVKLPVETQTSWELSTPKTKPQSYDDLKISIAGVAMAPTNNISAKSSTFQLFPIERFLSTILTINSICQQRHESEYHHRRSSREAVILCSVVLFFGDSPSGADSIACILQLNEIHSKNKMPDRDKTASSKSPPYN